MITVPAAWLQGAARHHAPRWAVDLLRPAAAPLRLPVLSGSSITKAFERSPRERASILVPAAGVPTVLDQRLLPTGATVRVSWGLHPWPERVVLFEGELVRASLDRPAAVWTLEAADTSALIAAHLLTAPDYDPPAGQTVAGFVTWAVRRTLPAAGLQLDPRTAAVAVPDDLRVTGSPWDAVVAAAAAAGCEALMRPGPVCVVRPVPVPAAPVDHLDAATSVTGYKLDHQRGHSGVMLRYEDRTNTLTQVTGQWWDTRPDSPTARARIGDVPWLEPGDTITVRWAGGPIDTMLVDAVEVPIGLPNIQTTTPRNSTYRLEAAA